MKTSEDFGSFFKFDNINIVKQEKDGNAVTVSGKAELLKDLDKSKEVYSFLNFHQIAIWE